MKQLYTKICRGFSGAAGLETLEKTPLYNYHINKLQAKMTNFAGELNHQHSDIRFCYACPISTWTNERAYQLQRKCWLFWCFPHGPSKVIQYKIFVTVIRVYGKDREKFIERIYCGDLKGMARLILFWILGCKPNNAFYTLILNEKAGVQDDAIVTKFEDHM